MKTINTENIYELINTKNFTPIVKNKIKLMYKISQKTNDKDVRLDLEDYKSIMNYGHFVYCGNAKSNNIKFSGVEVMKMALKDASVDEYQIKNAKGVLIHFVIHVEMNLNKVREAMEYLNANIDEEVSMIWGITTSVSFDIEDIEIYVFLATIE